MAKKVLIVDDEPCFCEMTQYSLQKVGYETVIAVNGQEAMRLLREEKPHIMLLDLNMPVMDGHEVCRLVRADDEFKDLPIILVTAVDKSIAAAKVKDKWADDYLIKPFDCDVLFEKMNNLLGPIVS